MMTEERVPAATATPTAAEASGLPGRATVGRVLHDQRKTILVGAALMIFGLWFGQYGDWVLACCIAGGILLGLLNHLVTEFWLLRLITSGEQPTRGRLMSTTILRLAILSVVAVAAAVAFWPSGIGLLLGLALFRLIALVMTAVPLLKELKKS